jgi:transcriptional regulator with XRE-family HTH domain
MKEQLKQEIGMRMREVRKALGLTQEKMVENFDIGRANYSRIEKGEVFPNPSMLNTLRTQFNVSLDWLITDNETMFIPEDGDRRKEAIDPNDYPDEIQDLLKHMKEIPMIKHAVLGFFLEYKIEHKKIIQEAQIEAKQAVAGGGDSAE